MSDNTNTVVMDVDRAHDDINDTAADLHSLSMAFSMVGIQIGKNS